MSEATWNLALERAARNERTMPTVPGQNAGRLNCEMSTGHHRLKPGESMHPFAATSTNRAGVGVSNGYVDEVRTGQAVPGQDDGSSYFDDWRASGGLIELPQPKTRSQDALRKVCVAWIEGDQPDWARYLIRDGIAKIERDDSEQALRFRTAMIGRGIYASDLN
jgi:hypothetical protein